MTVKNKWVKNDPEYKAYFIQKFTCINCFQVVKPDIVNILSSPYTTEKIFDETANYQLAKKVWYNEELKNKFISSEEASENAKWKLADFIKTDFFKKEKLVFFKKEKYFNVIAICTNRHCNFANYFLAIKNLYQASPIRQHKLYISENSKYEVDDLNEFIKEIISCYNSQSYEALALLARKFLIVVADKLGEPVENGKKLNVYTNFLKKQVSEQKKVIFNQLVREGNVASHELKQYSKKEAKVLLELVEIVINDLFYVPKYL